MSCCAVALRFGPADFADEAVPKPRVGFNETRPAGWITQGVSKSVDRCVETAVEADVKIGPEFMRKFGSRD